MESENNKRGGREHYFNLIHYKKIAADNWEIFKPLLAYKPGGNSKDKQLAWMDFLNEKRNEVMHASSGKYIASDELNELKLYSDWFKANQQNAFGIDGDEDEESEDAGTSD